jgi:hypothetical protein
MSSDIAPVLQSNDERRNSWVKNIQFFVRMSNGQGNTDDSGYSEGEHLIANQKHRHFGDLPVSVEVKVSASIT